MCLKPYPTILTARFVIYSCVIEEVGDLYKIQHQSSNEILHATSMTEAYKMARLLDLDYRVSQFYGNKQ